MLNMNFDCGPRWLIVPTAMLLLSATVARGGEPMIVYTPGQIIEKAITHHDPNGVWDTGRIGLRIYTTYSDDFAEKSGNKEVALQLLLAPGHGEFRYTKHAGPDTIEIALQEGAGSVKVNGSSDVSEADKARLRLAEAPLYRDYCEYLYGMPMKLRDPGTIIEPNPSSMRFNDRVVWRLKVRYDPEVGKDTWYFYFDHDTFALVGYRFYHDESKNDGEYIVFDGEIVDEVSGLRLPKVRAWYYNDGDGHLATDNIVSIATSEQE